jgi:hypothetical protein
MESQMIGIKLPLIDTENKSASLYSHLEDFNVLSLDEPLCS